MQHENCYRYVYVRTYCDYDDINADSVQGVIRDVTTMSPSVADGRDVDTVAIFVCTALTLVILIAIAIAIPVIVVFVRKYRKKSKLELTRYYI